MNNLLTLKSKICSQLWWRYSRMGAKVVKTEENCVKTKNEARFGGSWKKINASINELRRTFDEQIRWEVQQIVARTESMSVLPPKKSAINGIFFTGLDVIRKRKAVNDDVTSVVHNVLHKVGSSSYYTDVIAIHPKSTLRNSADSAIGYFQSTYHKRYTAAEICKFLVKEKYAGVGVRDLFLERNISTSRDLTLEGFKLKKQGVITKFWIENVSEVSMFYTVKRGEGSYVKVSDIQLKELLQENSEMVPSWRKIWLLRWWQI